jgi:hypothetical protein
MLESFSWLLEAACRGAEPLLGLAVGGGGAIKAGGKASVRAYLVVICRISYLSFASSSNKSSFI